MPDTTPLPPGPERGVDQELLSGLIAACMRLVLQRFSRLPVEHNSRLIWQVSKDEPGSLYSGLRHVPWYRTEPAEQAVFEARASDEGRRLMDYLWDHGRPKLDMVRGSDGNVTREGWEINAWGTILRWPLRHLLGGHALTEAALGAEPVPWSFDDLSVNQVAGVLAQIYGQGIRPYRAISPVQWFSWPEDVPTPFLLGDGVSLHSWTDQDFCTFMTLHDGAVPPK